MPSRVVIDPDGDILLQLQQEQSSEEPPDRKSVDEKLETQELTVSSKVLSLASPVFKAMISGGFRESIELAEKQASSKLYTLTLPENDIEATVILCRILHFSTDDVPAKPTTICLEKLAFLCDKYQCTSAMKYCGGLWLRDWLLFYDKQDPPIDDLCRLLIFAYAIDLPYEFVGISWQLFLYHKGPFLGPSTQVVMLLDHPLLHHDVARTVPAPIYDFETNFFQGELDAKRLKCCQLLHQGIMAPLNYNWRTLSEGCYRAAKAIGCYLNALRKATILPQDIQFTEHTFRDITKKANGLPYISTSQQPGCSSRMCACSEESSYNLPVDLHLAIRQIESRRNTLICLDCLKTDGKSNGEGQCRTSH